MFRQQQMAFLILRVMAVILSFPSKNQHLKMFYLKYLFQFHIEELDFYSSILGCGFLFLYRPFIKEFKWLNLYIFFQATVLSLILLTNIFLHGHSNIYLYQVNAFGSLVALELYFLYTLNVFKERYAKRFFVVVNLALLLFILFFEDRAQLNSYSYGIVSLIIAFLSFAYYSKLLQNPETIVIYRNPHFWFVTGLLLYYSLSMFIFLPYKIFTKLKMTTIKAHFVDWWILQNFFYLLMIAFFIKGFTCKKYLKTP